MDNQHIRINKLELEVAELTRKLNTTRSNLSNSNKRLSDYKTEVVKNMMRATDMRNAKISRIAKVSLNDVENIREQSIVFGEMA